MGRFMSFRTSKIAGAERCGRWGSEKGRRTAPHHPPFRGEVVRGWGGTSALRKVGVREW